MSQGLITAIHEALSAESDTYRARAKEMGRLTPAGAYVDGIADGLSLGMSVALKAWSDWNMAQARESEIARANDRAEVSA